MHVLYGNEILTWAAEAQKLLRRTIFADIEKYIYSDPSDSVGVLFGLRRNDGWAVCRATVCRGIQFPLYST